MGWLLDAVTQRARIDQDALGAHGRHDSPIRAGSVALHVDPSANVALTSP